MERRSQRTSTSRSAAEHRAVAGFMLPMGKTAIDIDTDMFAELVRGSLSAEATTAARRA